MSNKDFNKLSKIDQRLRKLFPTEMWDNDEVICTIELFGGFELFNTRAYHNYENWSNGYKIKAGRRYGDIEARAEDLDDAISILEDKIKRWRKEKKEQSND